MGLPKGYTSFYGKQNLLASINNWLMESIEGGYVGPAPLPADKEFFWAFHYPIAPQHTPAITVTERGLFNLGEQYLDRLVCIGPNGEEIYGTKNQTLIEIVCVDQDSDTYTKAADTVFNLRDRVMEAFSRFSIPLKDYNNPSAPTIGTIVLDPESNSINEKFIVDPQNQQLKRYVILARIFWHELTNRSSEKTITSNAQIVP